MLFKLVFFFLKIIILTNAVRTFPSNRLRREVNTSQAITIIQTRAGSHSQTTHAITSNTCITVDDPNVPTSLSIESNAGLYKIVGYSTNLCSFGSKILSYNVSSPPLEINSRGPICSFKLGNRPYAPVTVAFSYSGRDAVERFYINDQNCHDICDTSFNSLSYPKTVKILEQDGSLANNFIKVSEKLCEHFVDEQMNTVSVNNQSGRNLVSLTLIERNRVVRAFRIVPISQGH